MRANLRWDNQHKTIILCEFLDGWTWDDLHGVIDSVERLSGQVGYRVDAIVDLAGARPVRRGEMFRLSVMDSGRAFARRAAAAPARIAVVGADPTFKAMCHRYHVSQTNAPSTVSFFASREDARAALALEQLRDILYGVTASA